MASTYTLRGRLVDADSGTPLPALRVECWDLDAPESHYVGGAVSDATGAFYISFEDSAITGFAGGRRPDLFFRVFKGSALVDSTEPTPLQDVEPGDHDVAVPVRFPAGVDAPGLAAPPPAIAYLVGGRVVATSGHAGGLVVTLTDQAAVDGPSRVAYTDEKGRFAFTYLDEGATERLGNGTPLTTFDISLAHPGEGLAFHTQEDIAFTVGGSIELEGAVPAPAPVGLLEKLDELNLDIASGLLTNLDSQYGITTLRVLRHAGGVPEELAGYEGAATLDALAELDALEIDRDGALGLVDAGLTTVDDVADASPEELAALLNGDPAQATALRDAARVYATTRDALLTEALTAQADGRPAPELGEPNSAVTAAAPVAGCGTAGCMTAPGPLAYLAALTDLASGTLRIDDAPASAEALADRLALPLGTLPTDCAALEEEVLQARLVVEGLVRLSPAAPAVATALTDYAREAAYPALLAALGTSYEELAAADTLPAAARERLAGRLGLPSPAALASYTLDPAERTPGSLRVLFGLRPFDDDPSASVAPRLLDDRRTHLRRQWLAQDWGDARERVVFASSGREAPVPPPASTIPVEDRPAALVDPVLVDTGDIRLSLPGGANPALGLWSDRASARAERHSALDGALAAVTGQSALANLFESELDLDRIPLDAGGNHPFPSWADFFSAVEQGEPLGDALARLDLRREEAGSLAQAWRDAADGPLSEGSQAITLDVLLSVWGRRLVEGWRSAEQDAGITLSPAYFRLRTVERVAETDSFRRTQRREWERTLRGRVEQERGVEEALRTILREAERGALGTPLPPGPDTLRDRLLRAVFAEDGAPLETAAERAARRLLLDPHVAPGVVTTRVAHATGVLQALLRTALSGELDSSLEVTLPEDRRPQLEAVWVWLAEYDTWRAALGVHLYPENAAVPYLRTPRTSAFADIAGALAARDTVTPVTFGDAIARYAGYTEDLGGLWPDAACLAYEADPEALGTHRRRLFAFARSWHGWDRLYWSAVAHDEDLVMGLSALPVADAPAHPWAPVPDTPAGVHVVGAAPYEVRGGRRYVCLLLQAGTEAELHLYRYDLDRHEWVHTKEAGYSVPVPLVGVTEARAVLVQRAPEPVLEVGGTTPHATRPLRVAFHTPWSSSGLHVAELDPERAELTPVYSTPTPLSGSSLVACGELAGEDDEYEAGAPPQLYAVSVASSGTGTVDVALTAMDTRGDAPPTTYGVTTMDGWRPVGVSAVPGSSVVTLFIPYGDTVKAYSYTLTLEPDIENFTPGSGDGGPPTSLYPFVAPLGTPLPVAYHPFTRVVHVHSVLEEARPPDPSRPLFTSAVGTTKLSGYVLLEAKRTLTTGTGGNPTGVAHTFEVRQRLAPRYFADRSRPPATPAERRERRAQLSWALDEPLLGSTRFYLDEAFVWMPLLAAEALRRARRYDDALRWLGAVYDDRAEGDERYVYPALGAWLAPPPTRGALPGLRDTLDPHALLSVRPAARLRHVLATLSRTLLDAADAEFARDAPEAVGRARELYERAARTLAHEALGAPQDACAAATSALDAFAPGGAQAPPEAWAPAVAALREEVEAIPTLSALTRTADAVAAALASTTQSWPDRLHLAAANVQVATEAASGRSSFAESPLGFWPLRGSLADVVHGAKPLGAASGVTETNGLLTSADGALVASRVPGGVRHGGGLAVEAAATNLVNGDVGSLGFVPQAGGWGGFEGVTSSPAVDNPLGTATVAQTDVTATGPGGGISVAVTETFAVAPDTLHVVSGLFWFSEALPVSTFANLLYVVELDESQSTTIAQLGYADVTRMEELGGGWVRLWGTFTTRSNTAYAYVVPHYYDEVAQTIRTLGAQVVAAPYPSQYVNGTRPSGKLSFPGVPDPGEGTLMAWIRVPPRREATDSDSPILALNPVGVNDNALWVAGSGHNALTWFPGTGTNLAATETGTVSGAKPYVVGDLVFVALTWRPGETALYVYLPRTGWSVYRTVAQTIPASKFGDRVTLGHPNYSAHVTNPAFEDVGLLPYFETADRLADTARSPASLAEAARVPDSFESILADRRERLGAARRALLVTPHVADALEAVARTVAPASIEKRTGGAGAPPGPVPKASVVAPPVGFTLPPNPVVRGLRLRARVNLDKIRQGRNVAGIERPLHIRETTLLAAGDRGTPVRFQPTAYRAAVLIERARQHAALAQQAEAAFLSALEHYDAAAYASLQARQQLDLTEAGVRLQDLRLREAAAGVDLARAQLDRAVFQLGHFTGLLARGTAESERQSLDAIQQALDLQTRTLGSLRSAEQTSMVGSFIGTLVGAAGVALGPAGPALGMLGFLGGMLGIGGRQGETRTQQLSLQAQYQSTQSSLYAQQASYERRAEEWAFQQGLTRHDIQAGTVGVRLAYDRVAVAQQERVIAMLQAVQAAETVVFLATKFTSEELYLWMSGVLEEVFAFYLQLATATGRLALDQLAFERQEAPPPLLAADYFAPPEPDGEDRRGLTGSARLMADLTRLDQYAFETDRRKLHLVRTVSLAQHDPVAFARFRETGVLPFTLPMEAFDREFPGHYLRLLRSASVTVVGLIPPVQGIRATLVSAGLSTVVVEEGGVFRPALVRRDPGEVALSSPYAATGVFQLEVEGQQRLLPFEGAGVDTRWEFRLPRPANPFDFGALADVLVAVEYTALSSDVYRTEVIGRLDPVVRADRPFSLRDDFADAWYDLLNPLEISEVILEPPPGDGGDGGVTPLEPVPSPITFTTRREDFPPHLTDLRIEHVVLYAVRAPGETIELEAVTLTVGSGSISDAVVFNAQTTREGLLSTRRDSLGWGGRDVPTTGGGTLTWSLTLSVDARALLVEEKVEDVFLVLAFEGVTPPWPL